MINSLVRGRKISDGLNQNSPSLNGAAEIDSPVNVDGDGLLRHPLDDGTVFWNFQKGLLEAGNHRISATAKSRPMETFATSAVSELISDPIPAVLPNITITEGASVEIAGPGTRSVTFTGTTGTLVLEDSLAFTGQISGLAGSDTIDLADVNYGVQTQVTYLGNTTGGTLTITDGIHTANIALQGDYLSSTWTLSSDGDGGTTVVGKQVAAARNCNEYAGRVRGECAALRPGRV